MSRRRQRRVWQVLVGLRQRRDQVGHERHPRQRPPLLQGPEHGGTPSERRRQQTAGVRLQPGPARGDARRADQEGLLFYFLAFDGQRARSTKQTDPNRIEQRVVDMPWRPSEAPTRTARSSAPTTRGSFWRKFDWQMNSQNLFTGRYNYTWADQDNGTFDVDSWGRSANADEKRRLQRRHDVADLDVQRDDLQRVPRAVGPRGPSPPLQRSQYHRRGPAASGHGLRFRPGLPVSASRSSSRSTTTTRGFSSSTTSPTSRDTTRSRAGSSTTRWLPPRPSADSSTGGSSSRRPTRFWTTSRIPENKSDVLLYIQNVGVGGLTVDQAGTQTITQKEPAVFVQDVWQPLPNLTIQAGLALGSSDRARPDHASRPGFLRRLHRQDVNGQSFPSDGTIPSDKKMWQPRVGVSWDPWNDGKTVFRGNFGLFYARIPGLVLASTRSTNGSLDRSSTAVLR